MNQNLKSSYKENCFLFNSFHNYILFQIFGARKDQIWIDQSLEKFE
jgi:hypothetical protein